MATKKKLSQWVEGFKLDSWQNLLTGLGTLWDKGRWTIPRTTVFMDAETLENLFVGDPWARRIVEDPVDAAFRQGFDVVSEGTWITGSGRAKSWTWYEPDPDVARREAIDIEQTLTRIMAMEHLVRLFVFGRLWGREAILIGADDGLELDQPLNIDAVKSVKFLEILDRRDFTPATYQEDETAPGYGDPITWRVQRTPGMQTASSAVTIHASRLLMAGGALTSRRKRLENEWCDASVLQSINTQLQRFNTDDLAVSSMMLDSSQAVLKIRDFAKILAGEDKDTLRTRMDIVDRGRSVSRIMPIDAELEEFTYVERKFAGVHEIMEKRQQLLAGSVGWPSVILFGRSPAGLSATGEADIRAWYDTIQADRVTKYQPLIEDLIYIVATSLDVTEPSSWSITWPSLWQENPVELATRQKLVAETDSLYLDRSVLEADEVATARFGSDEWSDQSPQLDMESREALREQDLARAKNTPVEPDLESKPPFETE
jgi:phage-related protein (TIGR01555 family)